MSVKSKKNPSKVQRIREVLQDERFRLIVGIVFFLLPALYLGLSLVSFIIYGGDDFNLLGDGLAKSSGTYRNWGGQLGGKIANGLINNWLGVSSILFPWYLSLIARKLFNPSNSIRLVREFFSNAFLMLWFSVLFGLVFPVNDFLPFVRLGGVHGEAVASYLSSMIGLPGLVLLLVTSMLVYLALIFASALPAVKAKTQEWSQKMTAFLSRFGKKRKQSDGIDENGDSQEEPEIEEHNDFEIEDDSEQDSADAQSDDVQFSINGGQDDSAQEQQVENEANANGESKAADNVAPAEEGADVDFVIKPTEDESKTTAEKLVEEFGEYDPTLELSHYSLPTPDLLKEYNITTSVDINEQNANKQRIIDTLRNYGISIKKIEATVGPTITLYEIVPGEGIRISRIRSLGDDLALSLSAQGIRIIAPIPGKGTIGIEVPNEKPQMVPMRQIILSKTFQETTYDLPLALGRTITNEVYMVDLCKMPHMLVAGATGQGKSVGLNAMITSLLYRKHPSQLKFVMVDPKKVEFSIYSTIEKHFLAKLPDNEEPIITDVTKVVQTLNSLCKEMDTRYDLLKAAHVRNIKEYNAKFIHRELNPDNGHHFMPYIVVIIDEFGDLIMTAGKDVELPIARIAQLARAVGIHAIIATQRPTTNIITGTIKANFPARMAFRTAAAIDSRTILDAPGADKLIGRGDMLFSAGSDLVRIQCAFVDTPEIDKVCKYIGEQKGYPTAFELPEPDNMDGEGSSSLAVDLNKRDPLFEEAARLILLHQNASTSMLQRKFSIGYNKAGKIMDQMEAAGIVGPANGSKPRQILIQDEMQLHDIISKL